MKHIKLLDCTLRDGGYINQWSFGRDNIRDIILKLTEAKVDVVECGYLTKKQDYGINSSRFYEFDSITSYLPKTRTVSQYVAMINFGEFPLDCIPDKSSDGLNGIRVAFHKKDCKAALEYCKSIKQRGYDVYIQPMVTLNYTDSELLELITQVNIIKPKAFYLVDSFGAMKSKDLEYLIYFADRNLSEDITLGFHSHNNLQLSYSLAKSFANHSVNRTLIVDSSIMGMGRGAGNLNTELFADYLNSSFASSYCISYFLQIMDTVIAPIYQNKYWGYSLPYYLSATYNCHPDYAAYLDDKNTLTYENIYDIFVQMEDEYKVKYDREYISKLYDEYQSHKAQIDSKNLEELLSSIHGKNVLLLAPGKSLTEEHEKVAAAAAHADIVISVNFIPENFFVDFIFISNLRRWETIDKGKINNIIITSNIREHGENAYIVDYKKLCNSNEFVKDNAGMMLISLLIEMKANSISIAGLDGYSLEHSNFAIPYMEFLKSPEIMHSMNSGMTYMIREFSKNIKINLVTSPRFVNPNIN